MSRPGSSLPGSPEFACGRPEIIADPYGFYRELRETAAVSYDAELGAWLVARRADVVRALREPALSMPRDAEFLDALPRASRNEFAELQRFFETWLSFSDWYSDSPENAHYRAPWTAALSPLPVAMLRADIEEIAEYLVGKVALLGRCEVLADLGPLPAMVLARFLGLDYERLMELRPWIEDLRRFMSRPSVPAAHRAQQGIARWRAWLRAHLHRDRESGGGGMLDEFASGAGGLSHDELFALVASLLTGPVSGHGGTSEPTVQFLATALHLLLERPELLAYLRDEPDLIPATVDELLRFEPPVHVITRQASAALDLGGTWIEPGARVLLLLASANRDPAYFRDPDEIVLDRREGWHAEFGFGAHFCLGAALARAEIEAALAVFLRRLPRIRRAGEIRWRMEGGRRALKGLSLMLLRQPPGTHEAGSPSPRALLRR